MNDVVVAAEGLVKGFGRVRALDDVSLEVRAGEVVGLLGPNGAGKTTTLRLLAGLLAPDAGRATVCGQDVVRSPVEARRHLAFLTASTALYDRLTAREVLSLFGRLNGLDGPAVASRVEALSKELDLEGFLDRRCGTLSSGQKQRVSIARAVVHDPEVYVLDEPTGSLDPLASRAILELVRNASGRGKAVLFSTHRMEEAEFLCSRLYFLSGGKVVAHGSAAELLQRSGQRSLTGAFLHYAQGAAG